MNAFFALVHKDLVLHFSNRRAVILSFFAPIFIAIFFGSLFGGSSGGSKPTGVPIAVIDLDRSAASARVVAALKADSRLAVVDGTAEQSAARVQAGEIRAAVTLPAGFGEQSLKALMGGGDKPALELRFDPSQSTTLPLVRGLLAQHAMAGLSAALPGGRELGLPFTMKDVQATARPATPYNSYAHAFAGMGVQFILLMGVDMGVGLLLMRRMGLWKRLRAAPLSRTRLLGSRIASCALIALIVFVVVYAVAMAFFQVRILGSVLGFAAVLLAFSLLTASFGLLIAAIGRTPDATRGLAILATLLLVMLGGAWVPSFIFPPWLQSVAMFVPTHWALEGLDGMTWRGLPLQAALLPVGAMLGFTALFGALALWRFDWEE
jgi:ABC-2 type transport system permease protein